MIIPWQQLQLETLRALVQAFVLREGTDYGEKEALLATKMDQVMKLLESNEVAVVFDAETESCDLRKIKEIAKAPVAATHELNLAQAPRSRHSQTREDQSFDQSRPMDFDQSIESE